MSADKPHSDEGNPLKNWAKVGLFMVALGLVFGADFAFGFAKTFFQFIAAILLGGLFWFVIFGSINWVFERTDRKAGREAAIVAMLAYVLVGLPVLAWLLQILTEVFRK